MSRTATVTRKTRETNITVTLDLDGSGKADLHTGIGFFDHMLDGFARHGLFDLTLHCDGDLNVDCHHTIE
ncbi:MAG TPA: imidazoleglycerol-phosphate dehydratase, partial [Ruminococcaceae bacterium]|nr:imidazoleglycerol-phosphate dehydratase [Oscillospiraceae bacterium]